MNFEDHFSQAARDYARHRPRYPTELFTHLAGLAPARELAWDCGTGNGQAALALAQHFRHVVATDASRDQIQQAEPHPHVDYRVEPAESVSLAEASVDLVTVAAAAHWFDLPAFYAEVTRVLKPAGVLAVWIYRLPEVTPEIDRVLITYYAEVLAGYWPARFQYVHELYRTLPFPFDELPFPQVYMHAEWDLHQLAGFLTTWSATQRYREHTGRDPRELIARDLEQAWGEPAQKRTLRWPLYLRVGRRALAS